MEDSLRFLVDDTMRGLLKKLRMVGYDSVARGNMSWWTAFAHAKQGGRIIVTLLKTLRDPPDVTIWVLKSEDPNLQVQEVLKKIPTSAPKPEPFSRCLVCNTAITEISAEDARRQVPPLVVLQHSTFHQCACCQRIYWLGSHYHKMVAWMTR